MSEYNYPCPKCKNKITAHQYPFGHWILEENTLIQVCKKCKDSRGF